MGRVLCIEIGLQQTKVCEMLVVRRGGKNVLYNCLRFDTPANSIEDGYIRDKERFANALREAIKNYHFRTNKVIFTISSTKIYTKEVVIPYVKENKINDVLLTNITEYLPFGISDYIISHSVLEHFKVGGLQKLRIMLLAMPESLAKNYYSLAELMGFEIESLDYSGNSMFQILRQINLRGTNAYIQMNERTTLISIINDRDLALQRTIAYGTNAIVQTLIESEYKGVKTELEAMRILRQENLLFGSEASYLKEAIQEREESGQMIETVSETLTYLIRSIGRVLDYYSSQEENRAIYQVYLLGTGTEIKGLKEHIKSELGINLHLLEQIDAIKVHKTAGDYINHPNEYIGCIGAVKQPIGFQPKDITREKEKKSSVAVSITIISACVIGALGVYWNGWMLINDAKNELKDANKLLDELPALENIKTSYEESMAQLSQVYELSTMTVNNNDALSRLIDLLEERLPTLVEVGSIQSGMESISFSVTVINKEAAANLILRLEDMKDVFSRVTISSLDDNEDEAGMNQIKLSINCFYSKSILLNQLTSQAEQLLSDVTDSVETYE